MGKRGPINHYNTLGKRTSRESSVQMVFNKFGRTLQSHLDRLGWNQSDLAREASKHLPDGKSINRDAVSHYVRGVSLPRSERLYAIAKAFGVASDELLPPDDVPSADKEPPTFSLNMLDGGRAAVFLNRILSMSTATKISALLVEEDKA
jgi:transcriptional regulator with XRE-family HTH domain